MIHEITIDPVVVVECGRDSRIRDSLPWQRWNFPFCAHSMDYVSRGFSKFSSKGREKDANV